MNAATPKRKSVRRSPNSYLPGTPLFAIVVILTCLAVTLFVLGGASASISVVGGPQAQATVAPTAKVPAAQPSRSGPAPQGTAQSPRSVATVGTGGLTTRGGSSDGGFPWLPVVLAGLVAVALAGFALMRPRRTPAVVTEISGAPVAPGRASGDARSAKIVSTTTATSVAPAAAGAVSTPATVTCPNCNAVNDFKENFCHNCGQDLRPTRTALMASLAPAPPPDVVTDDIPYLETLDRTDEQLEYVLSRPRVLLGTASSSDIVIDSSFKGWQSVSPVHAELRREQSGYLLVDRGSQNGTFVNDARIEESVLADGANMRLGDVRFVFHIPES